jgi:phosphoribosylformimino-5-aminoimidazole carboxamide ribotide isomerase
VIVMPAIDVRAGACVQLVGGNYDEERVRLDDPVGVARRWAAAGLRRLHVVDLDAATGRGTNAAVVAQLLAEPGLEIQVGGGVRTEEAVDRLLAARAARVVVGTRAIEDPAWLARVAERHPDRIVLAADARGGAVTTHGWTRDARLGVCGLVGTLDRLPLAAVIVTAVDREGRLAGPDVALVRDVVAATRHRVIASGGIATREDLRTLAAAGAWGAVVGMALYTGAIAAETLREEFVA